MESSTRNSRNGAVCTVQASRTRDAYRLSMFPATTTGKAGALQMADSQYERLIEPHRDRLRRYAYRLTGSVSEADDLVQETLIRAYMHLHLLRGVDSILGWLSTIQLNLFRNNLRRKDLLTRARYSMDPLIEGEAVGTVLGGGNSAIDPEGDTIRAEQNTVLLNAIMALPNTYREAVVLCDIQGKSYEAIADHIGAPIGTVRSRIHRGRKLLRACMTAWQRAG